MKKRRNNISPLCIVLLTYAITFSVQAETKISSDDSESWWASIKQTLKRTWDSNQYDLYIPANTWHNRATYDRDKIDGYNERPWGIGLGKYYYDERGNKHSLYFMEFQDSHNIIEPIGGYAYEALWNMSENTKIGLGYTLSITARHDYDWIPFPAPLPILSFKYKKLSIQNTYVPGFTRNSGNILFTWLNWEF